MREGLVSIISPCYNVEALLPKLLDSILNQTYKQLEVILVDDGSSDHTWKVINEYVPRLEAEGYLVNAITQKNEGVASAIDRALKLFSGEFLTWPDSDDWLTPDSIGQRVGILRENPDVGMVRCNAEVINMETGESDGFLSEKSDKAYLHKDLFSDLVHIRTYFAPVCYMVRSSSFLKVNPMRSIYVSRNATQNLQMLLPISHSYGSIQIEKPLAFYLMRKRSLSRSFDGPEGLFRWDLQMWQITRETLLRMSNVEESFIRSVGHYFVRSKLLPAAFRAQLKQESLGLLSDSGLGKSRKTMAAGMIYLRCLKCGVFGDVFCMRYFSRILNKMFRVIVRS